MHTPKSDKQAVQNTLPVLPDVAEVIPTPEPTPEPVVKLVGGSFQVRNHTFLLAYSHFTHSHS